MRLRALSPAEDDPQALKRPESPDAGSGGPVGVEPGVSPEAHAASFRADSESHEGASS